jgi:hypothetical protein
MSPIGIVELPCATAGVTVATPASIEATAAILRTKNALNLFMQITFYFMIYNT